MDNEFPNLTSQNYILYAVKEYQSPNCVINEFFEDFKRLKYIKRLLRKYSVIPDIKERLILNHIICMANVFGVEATTRLLFLRIDKKNYPLLKTFLLYLEYLPDIVYGINNQNIIVSEIPVDLSLATKLRSV